MECDHQLFTYDGVIETDDGPRIAARCAWCGAAALERVLDEEQAVELLLHGTLPAIDSDLVEVVQSVP
jgi:hypothetical protein